MKTAGPTPAKLPAPRGSAFTAAPTGLLQRKCACGGSTGAADRCGACRNERLTVQRHPTSEPAPTTVPPIVHDVLRSPGRPLDPRTHDFMESRFGHDFHDVRIHSGPMAAASARAVDAKAYTVGRDIVLGTGIRGERLADTPVLAHELTHVLQARTVGSASTPHPRSGISNSSPTEAQADRAAQRIGSGTSFDEAPVSAWGLQCAAREGTMNAAVPSRPSGSSSMAELLEEWRRAGWLDPPYRPPDVPAFSPMIAREASIESVTPGVTAATLVPSAGVAPALSPATEKVIEEGVKRAPEFEVFFREATKNAPKAAGPSVLRSLWAAFRVAAVPAVFVTVYLWDPYAEQQWEDTYNPLTDEPWSGPEEFAWYVSLTATQRAYLAFLAGLQETAPIEPEEEPDCPPDTTPHEVSSTLGIGRAVHNIVLEEYLEARAGRSVHVHFEGLPAPPLRPSITRWPTSIGPENFIFVDRLFGEVYTSSGGPLLAAARAAYVLDPPVFAALGAGGVTMGERPALRLGARPDILDDQLDTVYEVKPRAGASTGYSELFSYLLRLDEWASEKMPPSGARRPRDWQPGSWLPSDFLVMGPRGPCRVSFEMPRPGLIVYSITCCEPSGSGGPVSPAAS